MVEIFKRTSIFFVAVSVYFFASFSNVSAYTWTQVGTNYDANSKEFVSMDFHPITGEKYVAFQDAGNQFRATVKKYNATTTSWEVVGVAGFSDWQANYISLAFHPTTYEPYVVYEDFSNPSNEATVMRFNGSSWVVVGSKGFTASQVQYSRIAFNPATNEPYIAYRDFSVSNKLCVMKFNGSSWSQVGTAGFSPSQVSFISMAFNPATNEPYVAYSDSANSSKASVMKFNGSSWSQVGTAGFSDDISYHISVAFNPATNEPYVAYGNSSNDFKAVVKKFDGSSWVNVGKDRFSDTPALYINLAFNPLNNIPYVVYEGHVKKLNGSSWVSVGDTDLSSYSKQAVIKFNPITFQPSIVFAGTTATDTPGTVFDFYEPLDIVGTPYASPYGNISTTTQTVTLTSTTTGATIYYTTDGTAPATSSILYTGPITISDSKTIKAIAVKSGQPDSNVMSEEYFISEWDYVGAQGFATGTSPGIAFDETSGTPYVVAPGFPSSKVSVRSYATTTDSWELVGSANFNSGSTAYITQIAVDPLTGEPHVIYTDSGGYLGVVKKFNGTTWVDVGPNVYDDDWYNRHWMTFKPGTSELYVSYNNTATRRGNVVKYNTASSSWDFIGQQDFTAPYPYMHLVFSPITSEPHVAIVDYFNSEKLSVMKYSTTTSLWEYLGNAGFTSTDVSGLLFDFAISPVTNIPYVSYVDDTNGSGISVMKYSTTTSLWEYVGPAGFNGATTTGNIFMAIHPSTGEPYVAFRDALNGNRLTVMKYDSLSSEWVVVGSVAGFSQDQSTAVLIFNPITNEPYVAFTSPNYGYALSVMKINRPDVVTPSPSTSGGTYNNDQSVTLSSATATSTIYYTTDGSTPTTSSTLYSGAITISSVTTLKAIAVKDGIESSVMTATYLFKVATTTASVTEGTYNGSQSVTLSSGTTGATIYYTTDGTTPSSTSTQYSSAITIASSTTLKAVGIKNLYADSGTMTEVYTLQVATPTPSVAGGTYAGSQSITLSSDTSGTTFYYTTDGSNPTSTSTLYSGGITISSTTTLKAIGVKSGYSDSVIMSESYAITLPQVATPTPSTAGGTYTSNQTVTLSSLTATSSIYYTLDGSTPSASSTLYTGAITIASSTTLKAIGIKSEYSNSLIMTETYTLITATPTPSISGGTFGATQSVTITSGTPSALIYYTTDGSTPTTGSTLYSTAISIASSTTLKAIAVKSGYTDSTVITESYTFQTATPTASPTGLTSSSTQSITLSSATVGVTMYYTTDGSTPTTSSTLYTVAITVASSTTLKAIAVKSGYTDSSVMTESYTVHPQVETPVASPVGGSSSTTLSVTLSSNTATSSIYYTLNGSTPTTSSTLYTGAISISSSQTLKAIAIKSGYTNSDVMSEDYTIASQVIAPTASVSSGTFSNNQSVTLTSATATSTIYYTTDGSTPTTGSTLYSGAISITASTTLKAIATKSLYTNSTVMNESYTFQTATPTPSTAGGTHAVDQSITFTSSTTGASIYYTLDGSTPSATSTLYTGAILVSSTTTIKAIAIKSGYENSGVTTDTYVIASNIATVTSSSYTVGTTGTSSRTISDIPYGVSKAVFLSGLTKGQQGQVWNSTGVQDPVTSGDTLVVTSQDSSNQITYTLTVLTLTSNQTVPNGSGVVTISTTTPEVVVTNPSQQVSVTVSTSTSNPTINIGAFIVNGTGTLPSIVITSLNADNTILVIPTSTVITSASTTWDGVINTPATTTITLPTESGQTKTLSTAIEVGLPGERLVFNKALRMLLPNQANKRAGYVSTSTFTEITTTCSSDNQSSGDSLPNEGECKIDNGSDLVIWTKHFTTFATYSQTATPSSGGSTTSGGSYFIYNSPSSSYSGGSLASASNVTNPTGQVVTNTNTTTTPSSSNLISKKITTTEILSFGSKGIDVEVLQVFLFNNGYLLAEPNGNFGPATEKAVKRFQLKYADELLTPQGFKNPTGMVGEATRKKINEMIASTGKVLNSSSSSLPSTPLSNNTSSKKITTTEILSFGSKGIDVEVLQVFLFNNGYLLAEPNGNFGPATEKAVKRFQLKYADELLTPQGFKNPTGMVGEATRKKINEMIDVQ